MLNGTLVIEMMLFQRKEEQLWPFDKARNALIEKNRNMANFY